LIAAAALGASAAVASADSSVAIGGDGAAVYSGDLSKADALTVWQSQGNIYFEDDFQTVTTPNQGCGSLSVHIAYCAANNVPEIRIHGFGGNDTVDAGGMTGLPVQIWGEDGNDTLYGAQSTTHLNGGIDDDTLAHGRRRQ
jgi:Ca2+-binding RTX toxin-like protein